LQGNLYVRFVINIREDHEPSAYEIKMTIGKLKIYKSLGIDQIQAPLIISEIRKILSGIATLINSILNKK
jgi:hypothetical protein